MREGNRWRSYSIVWPRSDQGWVLAAIEGGGQRTERAENRAVDQRSSAAERGVQWQIPGTLLVTSR